MGKKKYNGAIIKYKRWDTYYGDYGSFPYIWSTLPASQGECSGACQRQDRRTLHSLIRPTAPAQSDFLHTAAKSMGGRGPVYQFASMSSIREVCTPSPSPDCLAAKYAESTRV